MTKRCELQGFNFTFSHPPDKTFPASKSGLRKAKAWAQVTVKSWGDHLHASEAYTSVYYQCKGARPALVFECRGAKNPRCTTYDPGPFAGFDETRVKGRRSNR